MFFVIFNLLVLLHFVYSMKRETKGRRSLDTSYASMTSYVMVIQIDSIRCFGVDEPVAIRSVLTLSLTLRGSGNDCPRFILPREWRNQSCIAAPGQETLSAHAHYYSFECRLVNMTISFSDVFVRSRWIYSLPLSFSLRSFLVSFYHWLQSREWKFSWYAQGSIWIYYLSAYVIQVVTNVQDQSKGCHWSWIW